MGSEIAVRGKQISVDKAADYIVNAVSAGKPSPAMAEILGQSFGSGNDQARFNAMTRPIGGGIKADHFRTPIEGETPRVRQMAGILEGLEKSNPALAYASVARLVKDGAKAENA